MSEIRNIRPAGSDHQVVEVHNSGKSYRREPCPDCPWRKDAVGVFPAEAFRHSANTAHDMSDHKFGCHASGSKKPATCAGFLLNGADHNMAVRISMAKGEIDMSQVHDGGNNLFEDYVEMAIANGVPADDPALAQCRRFRDVD